ncbi:MAG TPA: MFS transporter [Candidatus Limnocylindria bacterium]
MRGQAVPVRAAMVTLFVAVGALYPFIPVYYQSLGLSLGGIGLLGALSAGAGAVASPLWGAAADRLRSPRAVMPVAALGAAIAAVLLSVVQPTVPLVITVAALAMFMAGVAPILDARALEVTGGDRNRYSLLRVWGSGSFIVSVLLVGWLIDRTQIGAMFAVLAASLLATGLIGLAFRSRTGAADAAAAVSHLAGIGAVLRSPALGPFLLAILLVWSSNMAINAFFSIHLVDIGADGALVGAAWAVGALVEIPVMLGYPRLGARLGVERLLLIGAAVFFVRALSVVVLRDPLLVTATMALHGIGFALVLVGGVVHVSRHAPPGTAATAQGVLGATVFGLAAILGPGVGGQLAGWLGLEGMFIVATPGCGLAVLALGWALRSDLRRAASSAGPLAEPVAEEWDGLRDAFDPRTKQR